MFCLIQRKLRIRSAALLLMAKLGPSFWRQNRVDQVTVAPVALVLNLMHVHCAHFKMSEYFVVPSRHSINTRKLGSLIFLDLPEESPRESEKFRWSVQKDYNKIRKANRNDRALHWRTMATLCATIADRNDDCKHWHVHVTLKRNYNYFIRQREVWNVSF